MFSPLFLITRCQLTVQLTGHVVLACLTISLFLVVWLVWLLKVSHPLDLLTPDYGTPLWFPFFLLEQDVSTEEAQASLNYRLFTRVFLG